MMPADSVAVAAPPATPVTRMAALLRRLEERRRDVARLEEVLATVGTRNPAVEGERAFALKTRALVERAAEVLEDLTDADVEKGLEQAETLLEGGDWRLASELVADLSARAEALRKRSVDIEGALRDRRAAIGQARADLDRALRDGALAADEATEIQKLGDLLKQAERALGESRHVEAEALVRRMDAAEKEGNGIAAIVATLADKRAVASALSQRTELLVLGQPVESRHEYTLMLRCGRTSSWGRTTLGQQDRNRTLTLAKRLATRVDEGARALKRDARPDVAAVQNRPTSASDLQAELQSVGERLYRLFIPDVIHRLLREQSSEPTTSLLLTTNDLELPWELLHDGKAFLCLTRPMGRMLMGRALPRDRHEFPPNQKLRFLLVHASPELPEARKEIEYIDARLRENWKEGIEIETWSGPEQVTGDRVNDALTGGRFDVIHWAGHSRFDPDDPDLSGLEIPGGEIVFAEKLRRLLTGQPLVFLNACESGRSSMEDATPATTYMGEQAKGLASALVDAGAIGCIGALWPVYDDAAASFAAAFYDGLLEGNLVGEALRLARAASRREHPETATWASFALYGDPAVRLAKAPTQRGAGGRKG